MKNLEFEHFMGTIVAMLVVCLLVGITLAHVESMEHIKMGHCKVQAIGSENKIWKKCE